VLLNVLPERFAEQVRRIEPFGLLVIVFLVFATSSGRLCYDLWSCLSLRRWPDPFRRGAGHIAAAALQYLRRKLMDPFSVHLDNFTGPLDLLLHLIRKNEMEITDIPIAEITSQYLASSIPCRRSTSMWPANFC